MFRVFYDLIAVEADRSFSAESMVEHSKELDGTEAGSFNGRPMAKGSRKQKNKWECGHKAFGKYCHYCKDVAAGRVQRSKKVLKAAEEAGVNAATATAEQLKPKTWKRAKCPYCGGSRVKKNEINAFSDNAAKEFKCTSFECGKSFNSEQVKEYEEVEVKERKRVGGDPRKLTD